MQRKDILAYARARLGLRSVSAESDWEGLLSLTRVLYPSSDIADSRYVSWEYEQNPAGRAISRIGQRGTQTIGAFTILPLRFQIAGTQSSGGLSVNTMTHPDFRGQGVFPLLAEDVLESCVRNGMSFILGFPNTYSKRGFIRDLSFKEIGQLPLWILPLNLRELARSAPMKSHPFLKAAAAILAPAGNALHRFFNRFEPSAVMKIEEVGVLDERFDIFWQKVSPSYPNAVIRDKAYLHWRYRAHPTRKYRIFTARDGQAMRGYIVTRIDQILGIPSGLIVDFLVEHTPAGVLAARRLAHWATLLFIEQKAALAACLMRQGTLAARALMRRGYFRCPQRLLPQPFPVILRWNLPGAAPPELLDFSQWYLTMGDYDAV